MKLAGHIPIDRQNLKYAIETLKGTASFAVSEKKTIAIAPEGTRRRALSTGPDELLPFKKGPFHLAKSMNADIVPVALIGTNRLYRPGQLIPSTGKYY